VLPQRRDHPLPIVIGCAYLKIHRTLTSLRHPHPDASEIFGQPYRMPTPRGSAKIQADL
jgi:hypothetical protein